MPRLSKLPKTVTSQSMIAALIQRKFDFRCGKQDIQRWRNLQGVGPECLVPFPIKNGAYPIAECFAWVEKYVAPRRNGNDQTPEQRTAKQRIEESKAEIFEVRAKREKNKSIDRAIAEREAVGVIKLLLSYYRNTDERDIPRESDAKLMELGVSADHRLQYQTWLIERMQKVTNQREEAMEKAAEKVTA